MEKVNLKEQCKGENEENKSEKVGINGDGASRKRSIRFGIKGRGKGLPVHSG
jgi:hypothetical protein